MREAKAVQAEPAADLASAWAAATMQERGEWLSKQDRVFEALWRRVKDHWPGVRRKSGENAQFYVVLDTLECSREQFLLCRNDLTCTNSESNRVEIREKWVSVR